MFINYNKYKIEIFYETGLEMVQKYVTLILSGCFSHVLKLKG